MQFDEHDREDDRYNANILGIEDYDGGNILDDPLLLFDESPFGPFGSRLMIDEDKVINDVRAMAVALLNGTATVSADTPITNRWIVDPFECSGSTYILITDIGPEKDGGEHLDGTYFDTPLGDDSIRNQRIIETSELLVRLLNQSGFDPWKAYPDAADKTIEAGLRYEALEAEHLSRSGISTLDRAIKDATMVALTGS